MFHFASLNELKDFLAFAGYVKSPAMKTVREGEIEITAPAGDPIWNDPVVIEQVPQDLAVAATAGADKVESPESDRDLSGHPVAEAAAAPEFVKRKRRTKAEIEADKAAEAARLATHNQANATADANVAEHGAEAAAAYAKPETTPAGTTAKVAPENTGNPFAQQALPAEGNALEEAPAEQSKAAAPADATPEQAKQFEINEFVAARLAERPTLEQREHLLLARTFIGKHGMPKYNESFQLVGLSPNVMLYSEADCARHAAALDFLGLE